MTSSTNRDVDRHATLGCTRCDIPTYRPGLCDACLEAEAANLPEEPDYDPIGDPEAYALHLGSPSDDSERTS